MAVEFIHHSPHPEERNRKAFEVHRPQGDFEVTVAIFSLQTIPDALSPEDPSKETRGVEITRYTRGADTLFRRGAGNMDQQHMEELAQTVWSQQRWLNTLNEEGQSRLRDAYKDDKNPLHAYAKEQGGVLFQQEELRWKFDEAVSSGNDGRVPQRSL